MIKNLKLALEEIEYFLLDMDGTIYLGDKPIGDMINTLEFLRERGKKIIYCTNNSSKSADKYQEKLKKIGFYSDKDVVYSSGIASAEFINNFYKDKRVFVLGTQALKTELLGLGVNVVEELNADIALLAYDTEITYQKLCDFVRALVRGAKYIATHPDVNCPAEEVFLPDAGSYIKMIETSTGRLPEVIIGKPNTVMGDNLKRKLGATSNKFVMVGDRLYTDIKFGLNNDFHTILVLSGETTKSDLEESSVKPEFVLDSLNDIKNYF